MMQQKIGVLLMAYGSPESMDDVEAYFTEIRHRQKPKPEEVEQLKQRYLRIGGISPLLKITRQQAEALEAALKAQGTHVKVYVGMKHWRPFIEETIRSMATDGISKVVAVALAPHYSKMSIGGYKEALFKTVSELNKPMKISFVESWSDNLLFLQAWVEKIEKSLRHFEFGAKDVFVLFTAHSLPESILRKNDQYPKQLEESCRRLAQIANLKRWGFAYQSAGLRKEKWLGPDVLDKLAELKKMGYRNVLIVPIGFVADHLEILYDIDVECQDFANANGIHLIRTESLNGSERLISALASIVRSQLESSED